MDDAAAPPAPPPASPGLATTGPGSGRVPPAMRATWHARSGRLSAGKRRALAELGPRWSVPSPLVRPGEGRAVALEIGAGTGEAALALAADRPDLLVVAAEVHLASLATMFRRVDDEGPANLFVHRGDGRLVLSAVPPGRLGLVRAFFPDPWPKRRHHGRRLIDADAVAAFVERLAPAGVIELATDDAGYATVMRQVLEGRPELRGGPAPRPDRPVTHYERLALAAGRPVVDLRYVRVDVRDNVGGDVRGDSTSIRPEAATTSPGHGTAVSSG